MVDGPHPEDIALHPSFLADKGYGSTRQSLVIVFDPEEPLTVDASAQSVTTDLQRQLVGDVELPREVRLGQHRSPSSAFTSRTVPPSASSSA